jgi:hypothetical protein
MNLVPVLDLELFDPVVINGWEAGQRSTIIPVAQCDDTTCRVAYRCHLSPADAVRAGCWEFTFDMYAEWVNESEPAFKTMDRNMAYGYVPDAARPWIMPAVCHGIEALVRDVNPVSIYRVTKRGDMPEKALRKHHMITRKFSELGYVNVDSGTDFIGRPCWTMSRQPLT